MYAIRSYYVRSRVILTALRITVNYVCGAGQCLNFSTIPTGWLFLKKEPAANLDGSRGILPCPKLLRITSYNVCYTKLLRYRGEYQKRMSEFGGMIRSEKYIGEACSGAAMQQSAIRHLRTGADRLPFLFIV